MKWFQQRRILLFGVGALDKDRINDHSSRKTPDVFSMHDETLLMTAIGMTGHVVACFVFKRWDSDPLCKRDFDTWPMRRRLAAMVLFPLWLLGPTLGVGGVVPDEDQAIHWKDQIAVILLIVAWFTHFFSTPKR